MPVLQTVETKAIKTRWFSPQRPWVRLGSPSFGIDLAASLGYHLGLLRILCKMSDSFRVERGKKLPWAIYRRRQACFQILTYHRVIPEPSPFTIDAISPDVFEAQMASLGKYFTVLPIDTIVDCLYKGTPLPPNCLSITFDDGYADNYLYAYPILKKYGVPATFFLATGYIGTGQMLWFDQVMYVFQETTKKVFQMPYIKRPLPLGTEVERGCAALVTLYHLRTLQTDQIANALEDIYTALHVRPPDQDTSLMLNWDQVREMVDNGYHFGSHTVSHPILSRLPEANAEAEITLSKQQIEEETGQRVSVFAYPSGRPEDYSEETVAILKRCGYKAALANTSFAVNSLETNTYQLNRMRPWEEHVPTFLFKLCFYKGVPTDEGEMTRNNPAGQVGLLY